ncbi:hypothetical protein ACVIWV_003542 [Bradyrhizobium diazoefficiens]
MMTTTGMATAGTETLSASLVPRTQRSVSLAMRSIVERDALLSRGPSIRHAEWPSGSRLCAATL